VVRRFQSRVSQLGVVKPGPASDGSLQMTAFNSAIRLTNHKINLSVGCLPVAAK
jgi:hypothetical protein